MKEKYEINEFVYDKSKMIIRGAVFAITKTGNMLTSAPIKFTIKLLSSQEFVDIITWQTEALSMIRESLNTTKVLKIECNAGTYESSGKQIRAKKIEMTDEIESVINKERMQNATNIRKARLNKFIEKITISSIRDMMISVFENNDDFFMSFGANNIHHAYIGGLVDHSLNVAKLAIDMYTAYGPNLNIDKDILISGALLHDIGKLDTLTYREDSNERYLRNHIATGFSKVDKLCSEFNIPDDYAEALKHVMLSHHGTLEFGAIVEPATVEAIIISAADRLDYQMDVAKKALLSLEPGGIARNVKLDGGKIYNWKKEH